MAKSQGVWGIDIGQCALKALRLEMAEGKPVATAFDYVEHPKILSQPDADPDQDRRAERFHGCSPHGVTLVENIFAGEKQLQVIAEAS